MAFAAVGVVGRSRRALLAAAAAAIAAVCLYPLMLWRDGRWSYGEPEVRSSCAPGCIPCELFAAAAAFAAVVLAAAGIVFAALLCASPTGDLSAPSRPKLPPVAAVPERAPIGALLMRCSGRDGVSTQLDSRHGALSS
jgi:hypothetical protein